MMMKHYRAIRDRAGASVWMLRLAARDDKGAIPAEVMWVGGSLAIAITALGLFSGKVTDYINGLSFP